MLRKKRVVTAPDEITDIIRRATTLRVGFYGEGYPYVVPVSFGFEMRNGKPVFYFHGAKIGCKLDLLRKDGRVCVESDIFLGVTPTQRGITTLYESFIAFGRAAVVTERDERVKGLRLITEHYGYGGYPVERCAGFEKTCVVRIDVTEITAKRNLAGDNVIVPADPGWKRPD